MAPTREAWRLEACSSEPIRTPGSIQPHGVFLAVDRASQELVIVSENTHPMLGVHPAQILGRVLSDFIDEEVLGALDAASSGLNPAVIQISGRSFDAIVHSEGTLDFVELEPLMDFSDRESASAAYAAAHRLSAEKTRRGLTAAVTREFSALSGFDRVMVYHFHPDGHGEVIAETRAEGMEQYRGLHFPASDIPVQARALYLTKLSRAIVSTVDADVPLVGVANAMPDAVDLSTAELRSVSPFHLQFMRNMGQASTVSFSLIYGGELIGMITCAHRVQRRLPFFVRRRLEVLANQAALQLGAMTEVATLKREVHTRDLRAQLLAKIVGSDDIASALLEGDFTLLDVISADAAAVQLDGTVSRSEGAPVSAQLEALLHDLSVLNGYLVSSSLAVDYPSIAAILPDFAGLLFVPLGTDGDYLGLFRREVIQSINWLGDLTDTNRAETLSPRLSFSSWSHSVTGTSLPWNQLPDEGVQLARDIEGALQRRRESRLATLAMHDPLTGLANRRFLMEDLERVASKVGSVSLIFVDLDGFKGINDTFGHEAGDSVITEVGRRLLESSRAEDRVVRLGGDEFVIMCESTSREEAQAVGERIAAAINLPIQLRGHSQLITASIGIVAFDVASAPSDMLERADAAMYRAKQNGRDQISS